MKVIISGGGTGGHIYPAIAIANTLKQKIKDIDILFIGAKDRMEMEKVPAAGYPIKGLWISGLQRRITFKNLLFPIKVISSLFQARRIIEDFKPDIVIGVGGYASGPTLRAATYKGIPSLIQEQNSYPGITNKLLAEKRSALKDFKFKSTGTKVKNIKEGANLRRDIARILTVLNSNK